MKTLEERIETKYIRSLRKELIKARRQIAHLKKQNHRLENENIELRSACEDDLLQELSCRENNQQDNRFECPNCRSKNTNEFTAGVHSFYKCLETGCGAKGRIEQTVLAG